MTLKIAAIQPCIVAVVCILKIADGSAFDFPGAFLLALALVMEEIAMVGTQEPVQVGLVLLPTGTGIDRVKMGFSVIATIPQKCPVFATNRKD